ncbi:hypothetical protein U1Q18_026159 [Sarracenia purpurea var. burkii]
MNESQQLSVDALRGALLKAKTLLSQYQGGKYIGRQKHLSPKNTFAGWLRTACATCSGLSRHLIFFYEQFPSVALEPHDVSNVEGGVTECRSTRWSNRSCRHLLADVIDVERKFVLHPFVSPLSEVELFNRYPAREVSIDFDDFENLFAELALDGYGLGSPFVAELYWEVLWFCIV